MPTITFLAGEGCLSSGISGLMDTFSIANLWHTHLGGNQGDFFETRVVTADGNPVSTQGCIELCPHSSLDDMVPPDIILIPPFLGPTIPDSWMDLVPWLTDQYHRGICLGAMCTGTFILAETGLLNGRRATTNWQFAPLFKKRYPRINLLSREIFTEDQGLFCTGGATAPFTLGLALVERHATPKLASLTAKALQVKPTRRVSPGEKGHGDPDILAAQAHMETHFARPLNMAGLAKRIGLSPRHFKRRFRRATGHNPLTYLQKIRVEAAKQRLETSQDSINDITWQIGYEDSSSFRRLFKRHTRLSPREYRDRFMDQLDQGELVPQ